MAPSKPHRSNSTNRKGPSAAPRRQQKPKPSVEYEPPPQIETTNRLQNLEDMEADQEDLEGDTSDSENITLMMIEIRILSPGPHLLLKPKSLNLNDHVSFKVPYISYFNYGTPKYNG